jgi:hypothetical protein
LHFASCLLVSTLYIACTMFCSKNAVIWAFILRSLSNGKESTVIFVQIDEWSSFASCWTGFDALYSVHYVLRLNAVNWAFVRRNPSNGKEITAIFCTNRRMVAFCELLDWFRRLIERALCSARKMQVFGRLYDELSPTGRKLQ